MRVQSQAFYKDIDNGKYPSITALWGDEPYLVDLAFNRFRKNLEAAISPELMEFNFDQYFASEVEVDRVCEAVETLPMMSPFRMVILRDAHLLKEADWLKLDPVLRKGYDNSLLVLVFESLDTRKKMYRTLLDKGCCVEFKKPFENQIPQWIRFMVSERGFEISESAVTAIHRAVGNHLGELAAEIAKLTGFVSSGLRIEVKDVEQIISRVKEENVFDLTKAFAERNTLQALEHLGYLLEQGQSEVGIVSLLARQVRILLRIKTGQKSGLSGLKLATYVGVSHFFLEKYVSEAEVWELSQLKQTLVNLSEADLMLKSSGTPVRFYLENWIYSADKACSGKQS